MISSQFKRYATGRKRHKPGVMNKTESDYAAVLEGEKIAGLVEWYAFEAITFKLAPDCRLTPDFLVMLADGTLEVREVKAFWEDDARVKMRVAADKFPFRFRAFKKRPKKLGGGWEEEEF